MCISKKTLLLELLPIKIHIYFYPLHCIYFKNIIIYIHKILVLIIRKMLLDRHDAKNSHLSNKQFSQHSPKSNQKGWLTIIGPSNLIPIIGGNWACTTLISLTLWHWKFWVSSPLRSPPILTLSSKSEKGTEGWDIQAKYCMYYSIPQACPLLVVQTPMWELHAEEVIVSLEQASAHFSWKGPDSKYFQLFRP